MTGQESILTVSNSDSSSFTVILKAAWGVWKEVACFDGRLMKRAEEEVGAEAVDEERPVNSSLISVSVSDDRRIELKRDYS